MGTVAVDDWQSEQLERDRTAARTLAMLGGSLFPLWIPFDAMMVPDQWTTFAALRLGISAMFGVMILGLGRVQRLRVIHALIALTMTAATGVIAALMTVSADAYLPYGIGLSLVMWACGLALSVDARTMAALQTSMLVPFVVSTFRGESRPQDVMFVAFYLITTALLCSAVSAVRLRGLREMYEANRALSVAQLRMAEERAANHAKSSFLARMSHELRTPLNAIQGYSELIGEELGAAGIALVTDDLGRIRRASDHLLALINDILDLSRIEAGELVLAVGPTELAPILEEAVAELRKAAHAKHLRLEARLAPDLGVLQTDPRRLRQIVVNLLSNAVKFTDRGEIELTAEREPGSVWIRVRDTGIGIPSDALEHVFEPFVQVDGTSTRRQDGTGLGLAIVRDLAALLGGRVELTSTLGVGTTCTVHLELTPATRSWESHSS